MANADTLFGVISSGDIASGNGNSTFPFQSWTFGQSGYQAVTDYTSPVLSASGSYTVGESTVNGGATAWASSDGGSLHAYVNGNLSGFCATCPSPTENGGRANIQWADTITISGLPAGTPVDIMLTNALNSDTSISGDGQTSIVSQLSWSGQELTLTNAQGADDGLITQSAIVSTVSGATFQFFSDLSLDVNAFATGDADSATGDASDTARTYITVLTPGASYTTASGATYDSANVPEPRSFLLVGVALAFCGAVRARRYLRSGSFFAPRSQWT